MDEPLLEIKVSDGWATGVVLLPDGGLLTTGVDPLVKRWNAAGELLRTLTGHEKSVDAMALLSDRRRLLTGSVDASVRLWDIETGEQLAVLLGHKKTVAGVAVSPGDAIAATASYDRTVRLWDLRSAEQIAVLKGHANNVVAVRISPDGSLLASGGVGPEIRLWSLPTGELIDIIGDAHSLAAIPAGFTPDGSRLLSTGADDTLAVHRISDLAEEMRVPLGAGGTHAAAISQDGRVAAVTLDRAVVVIDVDSGDTVVKRPFGVKGVYGVSFSPDGRTLATATADSFVRTWAVPS